MKLLRTATILTCFLTTSFLSAETNSRFEQAAQAVVNCIEAGPVEGALIQVEFDQNGECEYGVNIWNEFNTNPSLRMRIATTNGNQQNGSSKGAASFILNANKICGFSMDVSYSSEEKISIKLYSDLNCQEIVKLPETIQTTIVSIECGEIDPYEVGDACIITAETIDHKSYRSVDHEMDFLNQHAFDDFDSLLGQGLIVDSQKLTQIVEPRTVGFLDSYNIPHQWFSTDLYWLDGEVRVIDQEVFECTLIDDFDDWHVDVVVSADGSSARFFDNDHWSSMSADFSSMTLHGVDSMFEEDLISFALDRKGLLATLTLAYPGEDPQDYAMACILK